MSDALARARKRREEALAAAKERVSAEAAEIALANVRAKENGMVEKTAGESGAAGRLRNKWVKWLSSDHGKAVAERLTTGGAWLATWRFSA